MIGGMASFTTVLKVSVVDKSAGVALSRSGDCGFEGFRVTIEGIPRRSTVSIALVGALYFDFRSIIGISCMVFNTGPSLFVSN